MVIRPGSLSVVASADASHDANRNGRGDTGGCVGTKGSGDIADSYFIFIAHQQGHVTKSAAETEVVGQDDIVDYVVWSEGIRNDIVPPSVVDSLRLQKGELRCADECESKAVYDKFDAITMQCDNQAAIKMLEHGRGSFKRCKHILKKYFYITELIETGRVVMKWVSGKLLPADMLTKPVTADVHDTLLPMLTGRGTD